jgi:hypothetical protein
VNSGIRRNNSEMFQEHFAKRNFIQKSIVLLLLRLNIHKALVAGRIAELFFDNESLQVGWGQTLKWNRYICCLFFYEKFHWVKDHSCMAYVFK